jgi:hypothetical protein
MRSKVHIWDMYYYRLFCYIFKLFVQKLTKMRKSWLVQVSSIPIPFVGKKKMLRTTSSAILYLKMVSYLPKYEIRVLMFYVKKLC